jgi:hypothetical protein
MDIPVGTPACDSAHQQLWPVSGLGSTYVAVRYGSRPGWPDEIVPWRVVGAVDGTTLSYEPPQPTAPITINASQTVEFAAAGPFLVKSQDSNHPFSFAGYMTGADDAQNPCPGCSSSTVGDPEFVNIISSLQYLRSYVFLTDGTYRYTNLVFVRGVAADSTFHDVTLDCAGTLQGWQSIGGSSFQYTRVDLTVAGAPQGACDNGVHVASSDAPFGLTVWGYDVDVSYAYPAGGNVAAINDASVGPPAPL